MDFRYKNQENSENSTFINCEKKKIKFVKKLIILFFNERKFNLEKLRQFEFKKIRKICFRKKYIFRFRDNFVKN